MHKAFAEETKKVIKGGHFSAARYWRAMDAFEDSENTHHFCTKVFEILISSSKEQFLEDDHEAMYATLLFLEFYKNTKLKSEKFLEDSNKAIEENKPKLYENARWIINLYIKNYEETQFAMNFVSSIALIPERFTWEVEPGRQIEEALKEARDYCDMIQLKRKDKPYKRLSHISYPDSIRQSKISAYSYCCFLDYIRSINYQPKKRLWQQIMDNFKGLTHSLRFTAKSYELITLYLFFIGNLIKFYGCLYEDVLKELLYAVAMLRNAAGVISELACETFFLIQNELKCPGNGFRKELKRRFVNLDIKKAEQVGSEKYLLSYRRVNFTSPSYCSLNNLRKLIIYSILGCVKMETINRLRTILEPLDLDTTYNLYFKIMKIVEIASNLQTYESIQKLIRESVTELFKMGWAPYRKIKKEQEAELQSLILQDNLQRFFQFPNFQIVPVQMENLMNEKYEHSFIELLEQTKDEPYNSFFYSNFVELVFVGNDSDLFKLLNKVCPYLSSLSPIEYQKVAFYLVPISEGDSYLAQYLSYKDIWYKRYLYNVFREKTLIPFISLEDPELKDTFPSYLFTKTLHMYIRQGQRKVPFQVFECNVETMGNSAPRTIYFVNQLLMGASVACETMKNQVKKDKKIVNDGLETFLQKVKKVYPISIDIVARYKQPGTNFLVTKQQKFLSIEDLQICNTARPYFFGYKPNPLSEFIEVSILTSVAAKVFRDELQSRENFKRHSESEIYEAFRDLFINMTAESIVVSRSSGMKDPMKLLIDGVQINDVQKFKISPAYTDNKLPLTFPVRCFLPFEN